jgi:dynein intermediate chain 2
MDIQYVYIKKRHEFGRQCRFADMGPKLMDNLMPNKELRDDYVCKTAINRSTQYSSVFAEHEVQLLAQSLVE